MAYGWDWNPMNESRFRRWCELLHQDVRSRGAVALDDAMAMLDAPLIAYDGPFDEAHEGPPEEPDLFALRSRMEVCSEHVAQLEIEEAFRDYYIYTQAVFPSIVRGWEHAKAEKAYRESLPQPPSKAEVRPLDDAVALPSTEQLWHPSRWRPSANPEPRAANVPEYKTIAIHQPPGINPYTHERQGWTSLGSLPWEPPSDFRYRMARYGSYERRGCLRRYREVGNSGGLAEFYVAEHQWSMCDDLGFKPVWTNEPKPWKP